ncbi:MAG: hypothetical protein EPN25_14505 [Nitrospirae bacterium]|nr:MAG: hypothetical protein EPN25_14505 [Nitrospirota bacterium]
MKKIIFILIITMVSLTALKAYTYAEEPASDEAYVFPSIAPETSLSAGYRYTSLRGSAGAAEYEYLKNSVTFGAEHRFFSFPHRVHLDFELNNIKDYFGDINYAYEDTVVFRGVFRGLFHNLDQRTLVDLNPATASPGVDNSRDAGVNYGIKRTMSNVFLRFKTRDFPLHVYIDGSHTTREGSQQQRFLLGSGSNNSIIRTSQARDVDWKTQNIVLGLNSHLGPVEVDLSHAEKRLDVGGTNVFFDTYSAVTAAPARAAGEYPHNLIPELKGSTNTLKLHTSYTGSLVASATFSQQDRENQSSGTKSKYFIGAGELIWTATPRLVMVLKYRHKDIDIENPETVTITDRLNPSNTYTYPVEPSVTSVSDTITGIVRYRPVTGVAFKAEYSHDDIKRNHADTIKVAESTQKNTASLSSDIRLIRGVQLTAKYIHQQNDDPAYNVYPDRSDEGRISLSWSPLPFVSAHVNYSQIKEKRSNLHFLETNGTITGGDHRDVSRDRLLGVLTVGLLRNLTVTGSYSYMHSKIQQDIEYHNATGAPFIDPLVPYKDRVHSYSLDAAYSPSTAIIVTGGISHTISNGGFYPNSSVLLQPVSVASFSELKIRETVVTAGGEYHLKKGFSVGVKYRYSEVQDVLANIFDDVTNGKAHIALLTISKKW